MAVEEFDAWLDVGKARGWVSDLVCSTHDGVPTNHIEDLETEEGWDPCLFVLRVWEDNIVDP